jgi:hypothetical protein
VKSPPLPTAAVTLDLRFTGAVSVLACVWYLTALSPGVGGGDSGELTTAALELGIAHPPGYPLYVWLGHLLSWLPLGTIAERVAALSALSAGLSVGLLSALLRSVDLSRSVAAGASMLYAAAPLLFRYAVVAEVFALNNALCLGLLVATSLALSGSTRAALVAGLLAGLGVANHHTSVFVSVPALAAIAWRQRWWRQPRVAGLTFLTGLVGLLPYVQLPIAAAGDAETVWGDGSTWAGFWHHFFRSDYGTFQLASGPAAGASPTLDQLAAFVRTAFEQLAWVGLPLALVGLVAGLRKPALRGLATVIATALLLAVGLFHTLANLPLGDPLLFETVARFWILPLALLSVLGGVGLASLPAAWAGRAALALGALAALRTAPAADRYGSDAIDAYGRAILEPLPDGAVLLTRGDLITNAVRYARLGAGFRKDVLALDLEMLTQPSYVARMARLGGINFPGPSYAPNPTLGFDFAALVRSFGDRPVFIYPEARPDDPSVAGFHLWPRGFAQHVVPVSAPPRDVLQWRTDELPRIERLRGRFEHLSADWPAGTWEHVVGLDLYSARHRAAYVALLAVVRGEGGPALLAAAAADYRALAEEAAAPWYVFKNLGMLEERLALTDPASLQRLLDAWTRYLELAPRSDPDRAAIEAAVGRLRAP